MSPEQAEGFADALYEVMRGELATKRDVDDARGSVDETRSEVSARIREAELRLEKQIEMNKAELLKWIIGLIGLQTIGVLGTVMTLLRSVRV